MFEKAEQYKSLIDQLRPFEGNMLNQIKDYYKIGLTYTSNALEGNSLTETETKIVLEDGLTVAGKPLREIYETTGHAKAYDYIYSVMHSEAITEEDILTIHRFFYSQIDEENAGRYRKEKVIITGSKYPTPSPEKIEDLMSEFAVWLEENESNIHPIEFAAIAHKKFVFIHPFIDGNGRVGRLLMNLCLIRKGYTIAIIPPVLRHEYIMFLEKAHKEDKPFIEFIGERVIETQKDLLRLLK
jgi:Fic family protein